MIRGWDDRVEVVHVPSGIKASVLLRVRRSQHEALKLALSILKSRLWIADQLTVLDKDLKIEVYDADNQDS